MIDDLRAGGESAHHGAESINNINSAFAQFSFYQLQDTVARLGSDPPTSLLVIGCDTGREFAFIARICARVSALDISIGPLHAAAREHARLGLFGDVVLFDGQSIPYPDKSFDVVLAHHVLHHIGDPAPVLSEMWRVCRREMVIHEPANTKMRRLILALGLRPYVEEDAARVHDFSIASLMTFANAHEASLTYSLHFYPKPLGRTPQRWHRVVDQLGLRPMAVWSLKVLNHLAGSMIGTKITATFKRAALNGAEARVV
jgi:ubiquinone/menaquinone biosynthesis C-methylase UbiE